jgi:hypothetical protein
MAQSLEVNIKTTSDVPQAMDKAKAATSNFQSQLDGIGKKFSTAFKDIALGFIAPMIILQSVISFISASIAKAKQDAKDGLDLISKGESRFSNPEEAKAGRYFKRRAELKEESRLVETGRAEITSQVLANEGGIFKDFELPEKFIRQLKEGSTTLDALSKNKEVQGLALEYFNKTDEGRKLSESLGMDAKAKPGETSFKAPEGFGNVVGVGANPVMEAMTMQLEESRKQTALLESLNNKSPGGGVPVDFTKPQLLNAASRSGNI